MRSRAPLALAAATTTALVSLTAPVRALPTAPRPGNEALAAGLADIARESHGRTAAGGSLKRVDPARADAAVVAAHRSARRPWRPPARDHHPAA